MPNDKTDKIRIEFNYVLGEDAESFIELLIGGKSRHSGESHVGDLLLRGFSGYWLFGIEHSSDPEAGWLVMNQEEHPLPDLALFEEDEENIAIAAWKAGEKLPEHFYKIDRIVALKVLALGIKYYGTNFTNADVDYSDYDQLVQEVLLGEVVYG